MFKTLFKHAFCPAVTIVHRVFKKSSFLINKPKVHTPCINTDALDLSAFFCFNESLLNLKEKPEHIPVHGAV